MNSILGLVLSDASLTRLEYQCGVCDVSSGSIKQLLTKWLHFPCFLLFCYELLIKLSQAFAPRFGFARSEQSLTISSHMAGHSQTDKRKMFAYQYFDKHCLKLGSKSCTIMPENWIAVCPLSSTHYPIIMTMFTNSPKSHKSGTWNLLSQHEIKTPTLTTYNTMSTI